MGCKRKPRLLLIEDDEQTRMTYYDSLEKAGFYVIAISDGAFLEEQLLSEKANGNHFEVILSDTDMPKMFGDIACMNAINLGLINTKKTLILAMSNFFSKKGYWKGIASPIGFFEKAAFRPLGRQDIGYSVMGHYQNFLREF